MTLGEYVKRRNGVAAGAPGSLRNMLVRAFGAPTLGGFWRHWNPVFGYYLARYVHAPLRRVVGPGLAIVLTFAACGAIHDLVTMAVRRAPAFLFTPWFVLIGTGVALGRVLAVDLSTLSRPLRAAVHTLFLSACLLLVLALGAW